MANRDKCVSIVPYFKVPAGKMDAFKELCDKFLEKSEPEPKCLYYGWTFCGDVASCREGYADAQGLLVHLESVGGLLDQAGKMADLVRLEIHGPEEELSKLRGPLAALNARYFVLDNGFRR